MENCVRATYSLEPFQALAVHQDVLCAAAYGSNIAILKIEDQIKEIATISPKSSATNYSITDLAWSSVKPGQLAVSTTNASISVYDFSTTDFSKHKSTIKASWEITNSSSRSIHKIIWSPIDSNQLLTANQDGCIRLYDIHIKSTTSTTMTSSSSPISPSSLSPSSSSHSSECIKVFNLKADAVRDIQFDPFNPYYFAAATENGTISIWDIRVEESPIIKYLGYTKAVLCVAYHPTKEHIVATGSKDKYIKIWNLQDHDKYMQYMNSTRYSTDMNTNQTNQNNHNNNNNNSANNNSSSGKHMIPIDNTFIQDDLNIDNTLFNTTSDSSIIIQPLINNINDKNTIPKVIISIRTAGQIDHIQWRTSNKNSTIATSSNTTSHEYETHLACSSLEKACIWIYNIQYPYTPVCILRGHNDICTQFIWVDSVVPLDEPTWKDSDQSQKFNHTNLNVYNHIVSIGKDGKLLLQDIRNGYYPRQYMFSNIVAMSSSGNIAFHRGCIPKNDLLCIAPQEKTAAVGPLYSNQPEKFGMNFDSNLITSTAVEEEGGDRSGENNLSVHLENIISNTSGSSISMKEYDRHSNTVTPSSTPKINIRKSLKSPTSVFSDNYFQTVNATTMTPPTNPYSYSHSQYGLKTISNMTTGLSDDSRLLTSATTTTTTTMSTIQSPLSTPRINKSRKGVESNDLNTMETQQLLNSVNTNSAKLYSNNRLNKTNTPNNIKSSPIHMKVKNKNFLSPSPDRILTRSNHSQSTSSRYPHSTVSGSINHIGNTGVSKKSIFYQNENIRQLFMNSDMIDKIEISSTTTEFHELHTTSDVYTEQNSDNDSHTHVHDTHSDKEEEENNDELGDDDVSSNVHSPRKSITLSNASNLHTLIKLNSYSSSSTTTLYSMLQSTYPSNAIIVGTTNIDSLETARMIRTEKNGAEGLKFDPAVVKLLAEAYIHGGKEKGITPRQSCLHNLKVAQRAGFVCRAAVWGTVLTLLPDHNAHIPVPTPSASASLSPHKGKITQPTSATTTTTVETGAGSANISQTSGVTTRSLTHSVKSSIAMSTTATATINTTTAAATTATATTNEVSSMTNESNDILLQTSTSSQNSNGTTFKSLSFSIQLIGDMLLDLLEVGDCQHFVIVCEILLQTNKEFLMQCLEAGKITSHRRMEAYYSYIELLRRFSQYSQANEIIMQTDTINSAVLNQFGVLLHISCTSCGKELPERTRVLWCQKCHKNVGLCMVCHEPVRGLYRWCAVCGHGGHITCTRKWFSNHISCPTGCGHECNLLCRDLIEASNE